MKKHVVKNDGFVQVAKSSKALTMFHEYFLVVVIVVVFLTRKSKINKQLKNSLNENLLNRKKKLHRQLLQYLPENVSDTSFVLGFLT